MSITSSGGEVTDSLKGKLTFEQSKNRIIGRDSDNLARLLILADGTNFVMKVAKPTFDVLTTGDANLIFNSSQNVFKIVGSGTILAAKAVNTTFQATTAAHGLGYTPAIMSFIPAGGSDYIPTPFIQINQTSGIVDELTRVVVDNTNVKVQIYTPSAGSSYAGSLSRLVKYYLLQETAT